MHYKNGNRYSGGFKNGKFHGKGTFVYSYGREITGQWKEGEFIEE
jgi:hypothetical protein